MSPEVTEQPIAPSKNGRRRVAKWALRDHYAALYDQITAVYPALEDRGAAIAVASCDRWAGVSTCAASLARVSAEFADRRTLLVDGNRARPSTLKRFGLKNRPGLVEFLDGQLDPLDCVQSTRFARLDVLTGSRNDVALSPRDATKIQETFGDDYDFMVYDLPPLERTSPAAAVATVLAGVVFVAESGLRLARASDARGSATRTTWSQRVGSCIE